MRTRTIIVSAFLLLTPGSALAQLDALLPGIVGGRPGAREPGSRAAPELIAPIYHLAPTIIPGVKPSPNASGYIAPAPPLQLPRDPWRRDATGNWVYSAEFESVGAAYLRVRFDASLDESVRVFIYDPWTGASFGPYARHELARTDFWSTIIFGESIGVEVVAPGDDLPPPVPVILSINHGYDSFEAQTRGCSPRDASCEPAWQGPADAVCVLAIIDMSGGISSFCSGALINRSAGDGSPLVMTANHCLGSQNAAGPTSYIWFWQTLSCNGAMPNINTLPRSDGSLMLKRHTASDWNLVGLYEAPASTYFMGWNANYWEDDSPATGIHHPGGAVKQIAFGFKNDESTRTFCAPGGQNCFEADTWEIIYSTGFTIPGSSGSPIMSGVGVVRGTLSGGPSDDCTISRYGRFDLAFANLRYYLNNIASPVVYVAGWAGDPGNNGAGERGTPTQPFNTVHEATFAVIEGENVAIAPGNYNERFTIWRPMTLHRAGTTGIVRIGQ